MKDELYKKIYIHSEDDLPKEEGRYFTFDKTDKALNVFHFSKEYSDVWMNHIGSYLQPIEQPLPDLIILYQDLPSDEDIEEYIKNKYYPVARSKKEAFNLIKEYIKSNRK